jgi:hypothetical protein
MLSQLICHSPSQTSFSGHAGVVVTAAGPVDWEVTTAAGPFDEVHPAATIAKQRHTRRIHKTPGIFIDPFLRESGIKDLCFDCNIK